MFPKRSMNVCTKPARLSNGCERMLASLAASLPVGIPVPVSRSSRSSILFEGFSRNSNAAPPTSAATPMKISIPISMGSTA